MHTCRSHPSPKKRVSKKLFTGDEAEDDKDTGDGAAGDRSKYLSVQFLVLHKSSSHWTSAAKSHENVGLKAADHKP